MEFTSLDDRRRIREGAKVPDPIVPFADTMDRRALSLQQVLEFVREFKRVITPRYSVEPKVYLYGSYAKGSANPDSDIDVAVIVAEGEITNKWEQWADLWADIRKVNVLIEPVLLEDHEDSMLYREVMRTGIAA